MQDILLLLLVLSMFIFCWLFIRKLDAFLDENRKEQERQLEKGRNAIRIGFANPLAADSISDVLEQYSRQYPEFSIFLFHGDVEDLLKKVVLHKLDIVFLPEQVDIPFDKEYNRKKVVLTSTPVIMKYGGLPIEPIANGNISQNIVWMEKNQAPAVEYFIKSCNLENRRESDGIAKTESG